MAYEEPPYKIIKKTDIYEIRHYPERIVAQATYGKEDNGFRKLFRYITGSNKSTQEIKMTTPVTQEEIDNKMKMQFFLPAEFTLQNAPTPNDPNVMITTIKEGFYAVIQYSGRASDRNFNKHLKILHETLVNEEIFIKGPPIKATYNAPFTLPILRRNEAMLNIYWNN